MQKKTLYDLLEVSEKASQDAIRGSFKRLTEKYGAGTLDSGMMSAADYYNQIRDAFFTLGNEKTRAKYDVSLRLTKAPADQPLIYASADEGLVSLRVAKWLLVGLLAVGGGMYYKHIRDAELEARRLEAEASQNRLRAAEIQREQQAQLQDKAEARNAEMSRLSEEAERARAIAERDAYIRRVEREREISSRAAQWDAERERQKREQQRWLEADQQRRDAYDAQRRIDRERALVRELEWENRSTIRKGGSIARQ